jgi:hypothetical protein
VVVEAGEVGEIVRGNLVELDVEPTGLHVHESTPWLAGSPDGLIGTEGMVEAKCPYWNMKMAHQTRSRSSATCS